MVITVETIMFYRAVVIVVKIIIYYTYNYCTRVLTCVQRLFQTCLSGFFFFRCTRKIIIVMTYFPSPFFKTTKYYIETFSLFEHALTYKFKCIFRRIREFSSEATFVIHSLQSYNIYVYVYSVIKIVISYFGFTNGTSKN